MDIVWPEGQTLDTLNCSRRCWLPCMNIAVQYSSGDGTCIIRYMNTVYMLRPCMSKCTYTSQRGGLMAPEHEQDPREAILRHADKVSRGAVASVYGTDPDYLI